jgi:hypothetical protein
VTATTWERILEFAAQRPLVELRIEAQSPAVAAGLLALVQPLGADSLALSVNVSGNLKDGGTMNFAAEGVKPTHATKPLPMAQTIFTALGDGATYEAGLALQFGTVGRAGMEPALRQLAEAAPARLIVRATFERPPGAAA